MVKLVLIALVMLASLGAASSPPFEHLSDAENVATAQHQPRMTVPCGGPVELHFITDPKTADVVSGLLWQAGIPPGSRVTFSSNGMGLVVPSVPNVEWARAILACP